MDSPDPDEVLELPFTDEKREEIKARVLNERQRNATTLTELQQMGAGIDFVGGMVVGYFEGLVDLGLIDQDQWLAIQLMWEERFHRTLREIKGKVQRQIAEAHLAQQAQAAGIITPQKGISLPNGYRRVRDNPQA